MWFVLNCATPRYMHMQIARLRVVAWQQWRRAPAYRYRT
jgi:hypothetical protein